jgi:uncharacterized protein (TIGR04255 family)
MPFPPTNRVIYNKNFLERVICQLRFPPILRVDAELPAPFQDFLRENYPSFSETSEFQLEAPLNIGDQFSPEFFKQIVQPSGVKNYEFSSTDGNNKINLTRSFIAFSTTTYGRWENFQDRVNLPLNALIDIYKPSYFSRIGLRYINVIRRSKIELSKDISWSELIKPELIGMLGSSEISKSVDRFESIQELKLTELGGIARIISKIIKEDDEEIFVIDSDFIFPKRTEIVEANNNLNYLHSRSSRFIRWAITDKLHQSLDPKDI